MNQGEAVKVLEEIKNFLELNNLNYWLGRGVFRHFTLSGQIGEKQSDIDFHLFFNDKDRLNTALKNFETLANYISKDKGYTLNIKNRFNGIEVEFVFLFPCGETLVYHQSKGLRLLCDLDCFQDSTVEINGVGINIPESKYLSQIYGDNWKY